MTQQQTLQVQSINQQNAGFFSELAYLPIGGTAAAGVSPSAAQSFAYANRWGADLDRTGRLKFLST
jgi:hypothetical protein